MRDVVTKANDLTVVTLAIALALVLLVRHLATEAARAAYLRRGYEGIREAEAHRARTAGGL